MPSLTNTSSPPLAQHREKRGGSKKQWTSLTGEDNGRESSLSLSDSSVRARGVGGQENVQQFVLTMTAALFSKLVYIRMV